MTGPNGTDPKAARLTGYAEEELPDGSVYRGSFLNGTRHGAGMLTRPDGVTFQGAFESGLPHGPGTLRQADGRLFRGVWTKGRAGPLEALDAGPFKARTQEGRQDARPPPSDRPQASADPCEIVQPAAEAMPRALISRLAPFATAAAAGAVAVLVVLYSFGAFRGPPVAPPAVVAQESTKQAVLVKAAGPDSPSPAPAPAPALVMNAPSAETHATMTGYFLAESDSGTYLGLSLVFDGTVARIGLDERTIYEATNLSVSSSTAYTGLLEGDTVTFQYRVPGATSNSDSEVLTLRSDPDGNLLLTSTDGQEAIAVLRRLSDAERTSHLAKRDGVARQKSADASRFAAPLHLRADIPDRPFDITLRRTATMASGVLRAEASGRWHGKGDISGSVLVVIADRDQALLSREAVSVIITSDPNGRDPLMIERGGLSAEPLNVLAALRGSGENGFDMPWTGRFLSDGEDQPISAAAALFRPQPLSRFAGTYASPHPERMSSRFYLVGIDPADNDRRLRVENTSNRYSSFLERSTVPFTLLGDMIEFSWNRQIRRLRFHRDRLELTSVSWGGEESDIEYLRPLSRTEVKRYEDSVARIPSLKAAAVERLAGQRMVLDGVGPDGSNKIRTFRITVDFKRKQSSFVTEIYTTISADIEGLRPAWGGPGVVVGWIPDIGNEASQLPTIPIWIHANEDIDLGYDGFMIMSPAASPVTNADLLALDLRIDLDSIDRRFRMFVRKSAGFPEGMVGKDTYQLSPIPP